MKILKIQWRNFASYGNKFTELVFDDDFSLNLLYGKNGHGKTTISEVIQYGLFGKVQGKTLKDIPNRMNKSLEVIIELIAGQHYIKIHRGLEPNIFNVQVDKDKNYGDRANKQEVQKSLEDELYGIPYSIFNNVISLSINDFKSFIKMSPADKRNIIDKIFGLSVINQMSELIKGDIKTIKDKNRTLSFEVSAIKDQINGMIYELESLNDRIIQDSKDKIVSLNETLELIADKKNDINKILLKLNEYDSAIYEEINKINDSKQKNYAILHSINEKISLYNKDKCPTCGSSFETDYYNNLLDDLLSQKNKNELLNKELDTELFKHKETQTKVSKKKNNITEKLYQLNLKNKNILNEITELNKNTNLNTETLSMQKLIDTANAKLKVTLETQTKTERQKKFYDIITDILSDKGIKQNAIKSIIPGINAQIIKYMSILNLNFQLYFDDDFNAKIVQFGNEINTSTLSTGENKKLDFAIIIAIVKLMKMKFPGLNILFIDEIFSSLDSDSIHHVLLILKDITKELNLHIFVVNHAPLDNNIFTYRYNIEKNNGFSNILKEKII